MTVPDILGAHRAIDLLREVVAEFGPGQKYVNPNGSEYVCRYVHHSGHPGGKILGNAIPGCLVAQVLHRHGVSLEDLNKVEGLSADQLAQWPQCQRKGLDRVLLTPEAGAVLRAAQFPQDMRNSWGNCLAAAEAQYAELMRKGEIR